MKRNDTSSQYTLSGSKILLKSLCLCLKVKDPFSLAVSVLGLPMAFLPLLLSRQLQKLTDQLFLLTPGQGGTLKGALSALLFLGALFVLQLFWQFLDEYVRVHDKYRTRAYIKEYVLRQVCTVHYSYLENRDDFQKKISFADTYASTEIAQSIQGMSDAFYQLITFSSVALALWAVHPALVIILLLTSVPAAVLSWLQSDETFRHRTKWSEEGHMAIHLFHLCSSSDHGIQEVRHYKLFDYLKARWRAVADSYIHKKNWLVAKHLKANLAADFLRSGVYLLILLLTARTIYLNPALGLGTFTLVYTLSDKLQKAAGSILTRIMQFSASLSYMREFFSLENLEKDEPDPQMPVHTLQNNNPQDPGTASDSLPSEKACAAAQKNDIIFEHVSFTYPGAQTEVLHDLSLSIRAGEKIAIVGDNGSGKSTFISLLTGMFTPCGGKITIGGLDIRTNKHQLREKISVTFQDFARYEASLQENIVISDTDRRLSDDQILSLARQINVQDVILEQPEGLNGMLGHLSQKGNNLSGGQWQKVALLRAIYRDRANIMILDEPTAALDPLAETQLYHDFSQLTGEKTTLLISHRLGITRLVDRILVFKDGRIIEDGSHQELMKNRGYYYSMYQAQAKWYQ